MDARLHRRLGSYTIWALALSTAALIAVIFFLQFLWFGTEANTQWRNLVSHDWRLPSAVTLSTLVIRAAGAAQTTIAVSLVASVLLESHVRLSRVPEVSIMRFSNPGSWVSGWIMCETVPANPLAGLLGVLLLLVSLALQFSSTILLADFATVPALTYNATTHLNVSYGGALGMLGTEYTQSGSIWSSTPHQFPVFAEHNEPDYVQFSDNIHDTGVSVRALLPVNSQSHRELLSEYNGYLTMVDTRVACVRPNLEDVRLVPTEVPGMAGKPATFAHFEGRVSTNESIPLLATSILKEPAEFRCLANNHEEPSSLGFGQVAFTLCPFDLDMGGLLSPLTFHKIGGLAYLLFNHTNTTLGVKNVSEGWTTSPDGIWSKLRAPTSFAQGPAEVRATLCYDARSFSNTTRLVKATSGKRRIEPQIVVAFAANNGSETSLLDSQFASIDTAPVRSQLGATSHKESTEERGILDLYISPDYNDSQIEVKSLEVYGSSNYFLDRTLSLMTVRPTFRINSILLCNGCISTWAEAPGKNYVIDETLRAIFFDTLQDTGSPAVALQALFTIVSQMAYQRLRPYFYVSNTGRVTIKQDLNIPVHKRGFGIVVAMVLLQCVLVAASVVLFHRRSRCTHLADSWQVMAHVLEDKAGGDTGRGQMRTPKGKGTERVLSERARLAEGWQLSGMVRRRNSDEEEGDVTDKPVVAIRRLEVPKAKKGKA
ncbi:hypothetical protein Micbo1qcDRAFT_202633 [Microdochium bolleyi]|uniref:Uncharacterized protein n=1 Tax=Microdochium bolleyi TaxID=196109 RepID=A0A136JCI6_9PEZI|nr:hypothetical protein Micbo1qcDRAFT_202633 [Microdochium bolleyi]